MHVHSAGGDDAEKVLLDPRLATSITWKDRTVSVAMTRNEIKDSPKWSGEYAIDDAYAARLHDYFSALALERGGTPAA